MPPFVGQGVSMGLPDALELAAALASPGHPDIDAVLAAYKTSTLARMEPAVAASSATQDLLPSPQGPSMLGAAASA
jgi:2-polyprenyl-6-methoxyphenol hydroxylase-like FAD-dependent oxidoreductase